MQKKQSIFIPWKGRFFGFRYDGFCKTINGSPFEVSVLDPAGSFTRESKMVACTEKTF